MTSSMEIPKDTYNEFTLVQEERSFSDLILRDNSQDFPEEPSKQFDEVDQEEIKKLHRTISHVSILDAAGQLQDETKGRIAYFLGTILGYFALNAFLAYCAQSSVVVISFGVVLGASALFLVVLKWFNGRLNCIKLSLWVFAFVVNAIFIGISVLFHQDFEIPVNVFMLCLIVLFRSMMSDSFLETLSLSIAHLSTFILFNSLFSSLFKFIKELSLISLFLALYCTECFCVRRQNILLFHKKQMDQESEVMKNRSKTVILNNLNHVSSKIDLVIKSCEYINLKLASACYKILFKKVKRSLIKLEDVVNMITTKTAEGLGIAKIPKNLRGALNDLEKQFLYENCNVHNDQFSFDRGDLLVNPSFFPERFGRDWNFDTFDLGENCLVDSAYWIYSNFSLDYTNLDKFLGLFETLQTRYSTAPFHNKFHATDTLHSFLYFASHSNILKYLSSIDILATSIACLGHDVGHLGLTNRFLVSKMEASALTYNDRSIIENMNASVCISALYKSQLLEADLYRIARKMIIEMILSTDMKKHYEDIAQFKAQALTLNNLKMDDSSDKTKVLCFCLKTADISYTAKPREFHKKWAKLISEELFVQGELERASGIPVSEYCERKKNNKIKIQIAFIQHISMPLFDLFCTFINSEQVDKACLQQLSENFEFWKMKMAKNREKIQPTIFINNN